MKNFVLIVSPIVVAIMLAVSSCKYPQGYTDINAGNKFSVSIPAWMKEDKTLKPGADFQYDNRYRNFYAIGEVKSKDSFSTAAELMAANLSVLRSAMQNPVVSDSLSVAIAGLNGIRAEIFGKMNDEYIYFTELVLEGEKRHYHLSIWTRGEDRKLRHKDDINHIITSFKEIK